MRDLAVGYYAYNTLDSLARDDTDIIIVLKSRHQKEREGAQVNDKEMHRYSEQVGTTT